jgi:hypothetical protein
LRLPVDNPVAQGPTISDEDKEEDPNFDPNVVAFGDDAEVADDISETGDDSGDCVGDGHRGKTKAKAIRCSPRNFLKLVNALSDDVKREVITKGFGGLLNFKPHLLRRALFSWLMRKLNPESMMLEIGGLKRVPINNHNVWSNLQLPNSGGDPVPMSDADARAVRDDLGSQIVEPSYRSRKGITLPVIIDRLKNRTITGDLTLRAFFMGAFQCLFVLQHRHLNQA